MNSIPVKDIENYIYVFEIFRDQYFINRKSIIIILIWNQSIHLWNDIERFNFSTLSDLIRKVTSFAVSSHPMRNWYKYIERKCVYVVAHTEMGNSIRREIKRKEKYILRKRSCLEGLRIRQLLPSLFPTFFATRQRNQVLRTREENE